MKHPLEHMIEMLQERDRNAVNDLNNLMRGLSIEECIVLADGRATDALTAVIQLVKYIIEKEKNDIRSIDGSGLALPTL
jgi:hypothetical protein